MGDKDAPLAGARREPANSEMQSTGFNVTSASRKGEILLHWGDP